MADPTPEQIAAEVLFTFYYPPGWQAGASQIDAVAAALRAYGDRRVAAERERCAKIALDGGDGVDRLETAIRYGPNAAIAEAILALPEREE